MENIKKKKHTRVCVVFGIIYLSIEQTINNVENKKERGNIVCT